MFRNCTMKITTKPPRDQRVKILCYLAKSTDFLHKWQHGSGSTATIKSNNISTGFFNFTTILNKILRNICLTLRKCYDHWNTCEEIYTEITTTGYLLEIYFIIVCHYSRRSAVSHHYRGVTKAPWHLTLTKSQLFNTCSAWPQRKQHSSV